MSSQNLRLILFDVDGTLADSQQAILGALGLAFASEGLARPAPAACLSIVGLSLPQAMEVLHPEGSAAQRARLVEAYRGAFKTARLQHGAGHSPLYPGARDCLNRLHAVPQYLLGVATGKSRRGLDGLLAAHGLGMFLTRQVADDHPSKPSPSMILAAMAETGVSAQNTVMIGDTSYDMDMARAAGVTSIAVSWGYHPPERLEADYRLDDFDALEALLARHWQEQS